MPISCKATDQCAYRLCWLGLLIYLFCTPTHAQSSTPRIIALAPHLTELAYAAGAGEYLVGVVAYSDYPQEASQLPTIGDAFRFDIEKIVSLRANTALAWSGGTPSAVANQLRSLGIEVVWLETRNLDQIAQALVDIGQLLEDQSTSIQAAEAFDQALSRYNPSAMTIDQTDRVRIFYQISERPLYTFGGRHVINEVFERCGAVNVFSDMDTEALQVDKEAVIARTPTMILVGIDPGMSSSSKGEALAHWQSQHKALAATTLHEVDANLLVRPTPRIIDGIEKLCALLDHSNAP